MPTSPVCRKMSSMARVRSRSGVRIVIIAAVGGLALGTMTLATQNILPGDWNRLANSGAVWVIGAYAVGAVTRDPGWPTRLGGIAVLVGAVAGYYGLLAAQRHELVGLDHVSGPIGWVLDSFLDVAFTRQG